MLQSVQQNFLSSSVPVLKVMEELINNLSEPGSLDVKKLIHTLSDSLFFLGSANAGMVKCELPMSMQGLCRDSIGFTGSNLFGDNLNSSIKEVSELNKVSKNCSVRWQGKNNSPRFFSW